QLAVARLELAEQPHVLDGDDGLIGEGLQQVDLVFGKWPGLRTRYRDDTDWIAFPQHGHEETAPPADGADQPLMLVLEIGLDIRDVNDGALEDRTPVQQGPCRPRRVYATHRFESLRAVVVLRDLRH